MPRRRNTSVTPENTRDEQTQREPIPMEVSEEPSQAQEQRQEDQPAMEPASMEEQEAPAPEESVQLREEQAVPEENPQTQAQDMEEPAPAVRYRQEPVAAPQIPLSVKISSLELQGDTRAFATAEYGDLTIRRIRVKEDGQGRLSVAMPKFRQPTGYTETCFFNSLEARAHFQSAVLDTYQQTLDQMRGPTREQEQEREQEQSPALNEPERVSLNAMDETYDPVTLFDKPALFTCCRIDRDTVPAGLFAYDIRSSDNDDGIAAAIENTVTVNHMGTVIFPEALDFGENGYIALDDERGDLNFASEHDCGSIAEYQEYLLESGQTRDMEQEQAPGMTMGM